MAFSQDLDWNYFLISLDDFRKGLIDFVSTSISLFSGAVSANSICDELTRSVGRQQRVSSNLEWSKKSLERTVYRKLTVNDIEISIQNIFLFITSSESTRSELTRT
jgi:hypothetical protein